MTLNLPRKFKFIITAFSSIALATACSSDNANDNTNNAGAISSVGDMQVQPIEGQYIVVYTDDMKAEYDSQNMNYDDGIEWLFETTNSIMDELDLPILNEKAVFGNALTGFVANITAEEAAMLSNDDRVAYVSQDYIMGYSPFSFGDLFGNSPSQRVPYGTERVGLGNGTGKTAWVVDTGIDLDHEDLNVDTNRSVSFDANSITADDDNGHGSHVAGTIGAIDNSFGSRGVAANATLVAVKVLTSDGSGQLSDVIQGVDYVAANASAGDVMNLSLTGGTFRPLDEAVANTGQRGIYVTLAAGNSSDSATQYSPARTNATNVYSVSAIDSNDDFARFSNFGSPVDYAEPGVDIYSTSLDNSYATLSGTSMAAPHLAGVLLITNGNPNTSGTADEDPDGNADPIGVQ